MSIANSNFEEWTSANKTYDFSKFAFRLKKMSLDGALFDQDKLNYFGKEMIAKTPLEELFAEVKGYAEKYDPAFFGKIESDEAYFKKILNIEKDRKNPRKDYAKFSDIYPLIKFFYQDEYEKILANPLPFKESYSKEEIASLLSDFKGKMLFGTDENAWWNGMKEIVAAHGFAISNKDYAEHPENYKGNVSDGSEVLRVAITGAKDSPNLHEILEILGKEEVTRRLDEVLALLK